MPQIVGMTLSSIQLFFRFKYRKPEEVENSKSLSSHSADESAHTIMSLESSASSNVSSSSSFSPSTQSIPSSGPAALQPLASYQKLGAADVFGYAAEQPPAVVIGDDDDLVLDASQFATPDQQLSQQ